jgi:transposase-like protein
MSQRKRYTPEERDRILRLYRTMKPGILLREAADLLGVPPSTLSTWIEQKRRESRPAPQLPIQPTLEQQPAEEEPSLLHAIEGLQKSIYLLLSALSSHAKPHGQ